jgi:hypothetical protein
MIDKARIIKLVKDNKLKSLFGSAHIVLVSAREVLVKIVKKFLPKLKWYFNVSVGSTYTR